MAAPSQLGSYDPSHAARPILGSAPVAQAVPPEGGDFLYDPYVGRTPPPPPKPDLAPAAIAAAVLCPLPLGSLGAIFVGMRGLKQTRFGTLRGRNLAITSMILGALFTIGYAITTTIIVRTAMDQAHRSESRQDRKWDRKQQEREEEIEKKAAEQKDAKVDPPPVASSAPPIGNKLPPAGTVPQDTQETVIGSVVVVDIGVKEPSLKQALLREAKKAKDEGKEILVMTTRAGCDPCNGVINALSDPKMQAALEKNRLVRVDVEVFKDDLRELHYSIDRGIPGFYLISGDAVPRDGIDGGEWNEDIAANIAPVLNPFVRGQYKNRRKRTAPPGTFL